MVSKPIIMDDYISQVHSQLGADIQMINCGVGLVCGLDRFPQFLHGPSLDIHPSCIEKLDHAADTPFRLVKVPSYKPQPLAMCDKPVNKMLTVLVCMAFCYCRVGL